MNKTSSTQNKTFNIFMDESGTNKNSGFSVIASVKVIRKDLVILDENISRVESAIHIDFFHWSHHKWPVRHRFFYEVLHRCRALDISFDMVIKNNPLKPDMFLKNAIQIIAREKDIEKITIDGEKSHAYAQRIKRSLHEHGMKTRMLSMRRDETIPVLRLADGVAGLTRYHFDKPNDVRAKELFRFLENTFEVRVHVL